MPSQKIGVMTSGGDAPGMNACIRVVVRAALARGVQTVCINDGFQGVCTGNWVPLDSETVAGILRQGCTILGTGHNQDFLKRRCSGRPWIEC